MNTTRKMTLKVLLVLSTCAIEGFADTPARKPADTTRGGESVPGEAGINGDSGARDTNGGLPDSLGVGLFWADNGNHIYKANAGNVGIGTTNPVAPLHVVGDIYSDGPAGVYARNPTNTAAVAILGWLNNVARIRIGGDGAGATNGLDIQRTGDRSLMRILGNGNVGIGTTSPGQLLDVAGRMRVRQNTPATTGNTAGIWFYQEDLHDDRAFVGMRNNNLVGFYGRTAGWQLLMDVLNGNFRIGGNVSSIGPSSSKVWINAGDQVGLTVVNNSAQTTATFFNNGGGETGRFNGTLRCNNLIKSAGSFRIDHPLDPENKYLYHSFVESPDMMNIYNGNVVTDDRGYAVVTLPEWFESLNREFRFQLTVVDEEDGDTFVQVKVVRKIEGNEFAVRSSEPNVEVSWQVTGIRRDPWAESHRIPVEQDKPRHERGKYTHPALYGQPEEMGIDFVPRQAVEAAVSANQNGEGVIPE